MDVPEITDANDYYPFGMNHLKTGNAFFGSGSYKSYKYQGQELQETGFYSFKWRNYMPDVGRFFNIDPLSEKYAYQSHYNFSENAVVAHRELEGLEKIHFSYVFTKEQISVTKTILEKQGPLGNGVLVSSNHGGKTSYYYGKIGPSSLAAFKKYYEGANINRAGDHIGYRDHLGNPTIGYGHLIKKGEKYKVGSSIQRLKPKASSKRILNQ